MCVLECYTFIIPSMLEELNYSIMVGEILKFVASNEIPFPDKSYIQVYPNTIILERTSLTC